MGEWIKVPGFDGGLSVLVEDRIPVRASWRESNDPQFASAWDEAAVREAIERRFNIWIELGEWSQTDGGDADASECVAPIALHEAQPTHRIEVRMGMDPPDSAPPSGVYLVRLDPGNEPDTGDGPAYTRDEYDACESADWSVERGEWRCQGQVTPGGCNGTVTVTALCCYYGCARPATGYDRDGDQVCAQHEAQSSRYTITTRLDRAGSWLSTAQAARVVELLVADGWDVTIREPRIGEAEATYRHDARGLQILGFSIPRPEALDEAVRTAADRAVREVTA